MAGSELSAVTIFCVFCVGPSGGIRAESMVHATNDFWGEGGPRRHDQSAMTLQSILKRII